MLGRAKDLRCRVFGFLIVDERVASKSKYALWQCACRCGNKTVVRADRLNSGHTKSCGCIHRSGALIMKVATKEYRAWSAMRARVYNKHKNYGGRGIKICKRWKYFANFLSDMGPAPSAAHTLDRWPDNNGNYEPTNCRWATQKEQMRNTRATIKVRVDGKEVALIDMSEQTGLRRKTVIRRLERGWTVEAALSESPGTKWLVRDDYPMEWILNALP